MSRTPFFLAIIALLCPLAALAGGYFVGQGDILDIKILGEKDLSKAYDVADDGTIRLPWIRSVPVEGMTTRQIEEKIEGLFKEGYLLDPQVSVTVKEYNSQKVYILGHVQRPGAYSLKRKTRVLEALALAGGISKQGDKSFTVIRGGGFEDNRGFYFHPA